MSPQVFLLHVPKPVHVSAEFGLTSWINFMPSGMFSMAAHLRANGVRTQILHLGIERLQGRLAGLISELSAARPALIGVSLHWHPSAYDALELMKSLKAAMPEVPIVLGGITASHYVEQVFAFPGIDYVVEGDGEHALLALYRHVAAHGATPARRVPNVWSRGEDGVPIQPMQRHIDTEEDIQGYDFACFEMVRDGHLLPLMNWVVPTGAPIAARVLGRASAIRPYPVYFGRGCAADCLACGGNRNVMRQSFGRTKGVKKLSPEQLISIARRARTAGFTTLATSSGFGLTDDDYIEYAEAWARHGMRMHWSTEFPLLASLEVAKTLRRVNGQQAEIIATAESGSETVRARFRGPFYENSRLWRLLDGMASDPIPMQIFFTRNLPLPRHLLEEHRRETIAMKTRIREKYPFVTLTNYSYQVDPGSALGSTPELFDATLDWRELRDYYEAHKKPDCGDGFSPLHPSDAIDGPMFERFDLNVLVNAFKLGGRLERGVRGGFRSLPLARRALGALAR